MPELETLMGEIPDSLATDGTPVVTDDDDTGEDDAADDDSTEEDDDSTETAEDDADADTGDDDEEDDGLDVDLDDDEEEKPAATPPPAAEKPPVTDENSYILSNLPKITTQVLVPTADGKGQETKQVEVYGWGDLPRNMLGFVSPYEQGIFTGSAQTNELKARELQTTFRQEKVRSDTEAYTMRENKAIAKDLRTLRTDGLFPKFKGVPGSKDFSDSAGAKEFDRVVAFMNEQNDEAGKAAQAGDAFYHISFRQAYRMLHPEQFDKTAQDKQRKSAKELARRAKSGGGGSKPERNLQPTRVNNITDLADEFASFVGAGK